MEIKKSSLSVLPIYLIIICLVMSKIVSLNSNEVLSFSLATVFVAKDDGKQDTAVERPTKEKPHSILKKKETEEYEDFDFSKAMNF